MEFSGFPCYTPARHKTKIDLRGFWAQRKEAGSAFSRNYVRVLGDEVLRQKDRKAASFFPVREYIILPNFCGERSSAGRALDCGSRGRGFESPRSPHFIVLCNPIQSKITNKHAVMLCYPAEITQ